MAVDLEAAVAHGMECTWWGKLSDARRVLDGGEMRYECPECGGWVNAVESEDKLFELIGAMNDTGLADRVRWMRGRCYGTDAEAKAAYDLARSEGGK